MPKSKRKKRRSRGKSGYIGVIKKSSGRYRASIVINGKFKSLGSSYDTAKQAAKAYDKEAIKSLKPFSSLNYPKKAPAGYTPMQQPLYSNKAVGYRGVTKNGRNKKKFIVHLTLDGKIKHIGTYDTAKEAAVAYDRAVLNANRCTTLLNFPDMVHNLDVEPKRKKYKRSSTGYRGVIQLPSGRFYSKICINSINTTIGTFDTAIQAALAYDQAAIKKGNQKSTLNFPMDRKDEKKQKKREKQTKQTKETKQKKQKKTKKKTKKKNLLTIQEYKEMLYGDME